jgi:hypothetical protein
VLWSGTAPTIDGSTIGTFVTGTDAGTTSPTLAHVTVGGAGAAGAGGMGGAAAATGANAGTDGTSGVAGMAAGIAQIQ